MSKFGFGSGMLFSKNKNHHHNPLGGDSNNPNKKNQPQDGGMPEMPMGNRNILLWILIAVLAFGILKVVFDETQNQNKKKLSYSEFITAVDGGQVEKVKITGNTIDGVFNDKSLFTTHSPVFEPNLPDRMVKAGVTVEYEPVDNGGFSFFSILINWLPIILLIGVWIYFMRQMNGGGGKMMGFGRSKARMIDPEEHKITFANVAGVDEAKEELEEVVEFLRNPEKFAKLGGKIPKGMLLVGSPGTGKTLLAKAISGEAGVPFFTISGSDFMEMFVGVGASRVRDMFEQAKQNAPCIVFVDEIDAVGRHRGAGLGGGNDEREQTLNQLLVEMDGFSDNQGVIIMAATNRPDVLDPALLRPGRFDRQVVVPLPDIKGREEILRVHSKKVPLADDVDLSLIARGAAGFSGADLANLVNEACLMAAKKNEKQITLRHFGDAMDKIMMGTERRSMVMDEHQQKITAYHEAGHAIVALFVPNYHPLYKISIIPRGRALGVTIMLPEKDQYGHSKSHLLSQLAVMYGGRVAERLIFGPDEITNGASDDIKRATDIAHRMVTEWGMYDALGPLHYSDNQEEVFLGHSVTKTKNISDETAQKIDAAMHHLITDAEKWAEEILTKHKDKFEKLSLALLEKETMNRDEVDELLGLKSSQDIAIDAKKMANDEGKAPKAKKKTTKTTDKA